ncbi:MAG: twin transmembrane helix small protein [Gammaproteobacteria bacterium]|nr:twin transmembrane helix small protein [Gammaproteobacteria bacterium]
MSLFKIVVIAFLVAIAGSLGTALFTLVRDKGQSRRTLNSLTLRVVLSIGLFALLMFGFLTGLIQPHGVYPR